MNSHIKQISWLVTFSIAMGFLEAAVVVYLRALYYKQGFQFPLVEMDSALAVTELAREAATLVMLVGVAALAGRSFYQRLSFFLLAFAVWDLFYYVFLKLILDWPKSWFTWDILFLLPVPWIGPVLSPCLVSLTMLLLAALIYLRDTRNRPVHLNLSEWLIILGGSFIVFLSWTWDYFNLDQGYPIVSGEKSVAFFSSFIPDVFNWWIFGSGEGLILVGIFIFFSRTQKKSKAN